jgi:hypothetical protein
VCSFRLASTVVEVQEQTENTVRKVNEMDGNVSAKFRGLTRYLQELRSSIQAISSPNTALSLWDSEDIAAATIKALRENKEETCIFQSGQNAPILQHSMENKALRTVHHSGQFGFAELAHDNEVADNPTFRNAQGDHLNLSSSYIASKERHDAISRKKSLEDNRSRVNNA